MNTKTKEITINVDANYKYNYCLSELIYAALPDVTYEDIAKSAINFDIAIGFNELNSKIKCSFPDISYMGKNIDISKLDRIFYLNNDVVNVIKVNLI